MKSLIRIVALGLVAVVGVLAVGCTHGERALDTESVYMPKYATGFEVVREKSSGAHLLLVKNPWQGAEQVRLYAALDATPIPDFEGVHIATPAQRIVAMSSSYVAMLDAIGCQERIVGVSGARFVSTPSVRRAIESKEVCEVGHDANLDFELIKSLNTDLVLLYGVSAEEKSVTNKLDELSIPYIYIGDYVESEPLGKAEWVMALAWLCGCPEKGEEFFKGVEERYLSIRDKRYCSAYRPQVMLNLPYRDTWFMPSTKSYAVRLIEDAGGEYIYPQNDSNSTVPVSLEEALLLAGKADFWLNLGQISSLDELRNAVPRFAKVEAVRSGRVYNNNLRQSVGGGSDFWESGAVRPDVVLHDLVKILHFEAPTDSLYYYKKLE